MQTNSSFPDDWKSDSIRSIVDPARPITYGVVQPGERLKQGIAIIRGQDYSRGIVDDSDLYLIHPHIAEAYARSSLKGGDILFSIVGYLGQTAVVPPTLSGANITQTTARIAVKSPNQSRFFLHQFRSELFAPEVRRFQKGSAQPGLNLNDVEKMVVVIPPPHEQTRIAGVLDTVDGAIANTEAVIAKLKQVRAGLLHDLLTRGLDENGQLRDPVTHPEQFQDSALGWIPKEWKLLPLSEIADVDRGKFGHRPRNDPDFYGGQFPFIQTGDVAIANGEIITNASQSLNERGVSVSKIFPVGTIAVTIAANIGDTAILGFPMYFPDSVVGIVVSSPNVVRWVELVLRRAKQRLNALAPQSAQKNINLEFLRPLLVPVPSSTEQERCSEVFEAVNKEIKTEEEVGEKLTSIKSGLMNDLLTGRVRVPEGIAVTG